MPSVSRNFGKRALITGITGQDGSYLAELLVGKDYKVFGMARNTEGDSLRNIEKLYKDKKISLIQGDLSDSQSIKNAVEVSKPSEVYNLAGISDLSTAIKNPKETIKVNYEAVGVLLIKAFEINPKIRFCQASSREIFSKKALPPQNENAMRGPENPYGVAKQMVDEEYIVGFRNKGVFSCSAILFNHESPRREERFVTRKITNTLVKIKLGLAECLELGNLNSKRDWGFAGDFVEGMYLMLQKDKPDDFVLATGVTHTVRDFVSEAGKVLGIKIKWEGENENEIGKDENGTIIVKVNPSFFRPTEKFDFVGDISKAKKELHWTPKTTFESLVKTMVLNDIEKLKNSN